MGFGKLVFGFFLVGMGVLFLAGTFGILPAAAWPWLARFWPVLLLAFGVALLANALKNIVLGVFALALVVGAFVVGGYWISKRTGATQPAEASAFELGRVRAVALKGRTIAGSFSIAGDPELKGKLLVSARDLLGRRSAALEWEAVRGAGLLSWPRASGGGRADTGKAPGSAPDRALASLGGGIDIRLPTGMPVRLDQASYFSFGTADLTRLRPGLVEMRAVSSSARFLVGAVRPPRIRVRGFLSNVEITLPAECPARVEYSSPLTLHSFPKDFLEHVSARVKGRAAYWTAPGRGPPVVIQVEGPLMRLRVIREPGPVGR